MKVYVEPINFWRDGYNLLDVVIIIIVSIPYALRKIKGNRYKNLHIADGIQSLRILKVIPYSRGIRVSRGARAHARTVGRSLKNNDWSVIFLLIRLTVWWVNLYQHHPGLEAGKKGVVSFIPEMNKLSLSGPQPRLPLETRNGHLVADQLTVNGFMCRSQFMSNTAGHLLSGHTSRLGV